MNRKNGRGGDRPLVWVELASDKTSIVERVRDLGWRIVDLHLYGGNLPPGPPPDGAFVERLPDDPLVTELQAAGCHVVRVGHLAHPDDHLLPAVIVYRVAGGRLAAEHFAERRFLHVGFVCYRAMLDDGDALVLYESFRDRARELGCECHQLMFSNWPAEKDAARPWHEKHRLRQEEFARWLQRVPKPIGLFTFSDNMAGRLVVTALEQGFTVPQSVAVLGYGGERATCVSAPVLLSSVDPGTDAQCEAAVCLMQDLMAGKPAPTAAVRVPPVGIVVRESTDVLSCDDPNVALAIRFMWDHLDSDLSVNDVANAVSMSRRTLERAFHEQLGYGVNAEWQRRRLERCCELLKTTKLTITDIAPMVGFHSKDYLHTLFRGTYGTTPREYRLQSAG